MLGSPWARCSIFALVSTLFALTQGGQVNKASVILAKDIASPVELADREDRLRNGEVRKLWHQTTLPVCQAILSSRFYLGKSGIAGGGIYFAQEDWHTGYKAEQKGCLIEVWVALGRVKKLPFQGDHGITPAKMLRAGYDAVWIPRGCSGPPCDRAPMPENVIYFSDQILQMSAYKCSPDGRRKIGPYLADTGPLSTTPPTFVHSEGVEGNPLRFYRSISSVEDPASASSAEASRPSRAEDPTPISECPDVRYWMMVAFVLGAAVTSMIWGIFSFLCLKSHSSREPRLRAVDVESDSDEFSTDDA